MTKFRWFTAAGAAVEPTVIEIANGAYGPPVVVSAGEKRVSFADLVQPSRQQILVTAQGLITENFPRCGVGTVSILIDGTVYYVLIGLRRGDLVSNIHVCVTAASVSSTVSKVGLYDTTGARVAVSADLGTAWEAAGEKTHALATPYRVTADGAFYVAVLAKASTLPTLLRGPNTTHAASGFGTGAQSYGTVASQTDLDAQEALTETSPIGIWAGVS